MTAEELRRGYGRLFDQIDTDSDGAIVRSDLEQMANSLAHTFGQTASTPKARDVRDHYSRTWELLCEDLGVDAGGEIAREEFGEAMANLSTQDGFLAHVRAVAAAEFALADPDDDGVLAKEDFVRLIEAFGPSGEDAKAAFTRLDRDGDGRIRREEYASARQEYLTSGDPDAPGRWLFGAPQ
ncbi:EF-hand domain-containing protein [Streptoalloteichus hindustanus]|uniref:Ca2+-binding protein, EF-hand superfamily n=1 Tax=Streptoalloteichus hindustanus TaxID=2017 RepID=A0A1M5ES48_STRHI|nr:EF-hand domain-containing protein [Streptoalloteichus hindustanus]SHF81842.1 Ca2+-binding protein, EF-hand superfamily [Streptoalloteichus hindustanus]